MSEDSRKTIPAGQQNQIEELTEEQLNDVSGGEQLMAHMPVGFKKCAVNPQHRWLNVYAACPECGSTEFTSILPPD